LKISIFNKGKKLESMFATEATGTERGEAVSSKRQQSQQRVKNRSRVNFHEDLEKKRGFFTQRAG
jgi:hypothetical protein